MTERPSKIKRRTLIQSAVAGLALSPLALSGMSKSAVGEGPVSGKITGKGVGDFDFLAGEWKIKHRKLKEGTTDDWQEFESGATVHRVLNGMGSIEELRGPKGNDFGMGVRVWHPGEKMWADHWTSAANGVVNAPQMGQFIDGEGVFISDDEMDGKPIKARGMWDRITPMSCRWHQSTSNDGGKTWVYNWYMDWTRV